MITTNVGIPQNVPVTWPDLTKLKNESKSNKRFIAEMDTYAIYFAKKFPKQCANIGIRFKFLGAALDKVNNQKNFGIESIVSTCIMLYEKSSLKLMFLRNIAYRNIRQYYQKIFERSFFDIYFNFRRCEYLLKYSLIIAKMSKRAARAALLSFKGYHGRGRA